MTAAPSDYRPTPGPADRVTFFAEQRRSRRKSWRFSLLAFVTVLLTGIPVSVMVTPYIYAFALFAAHVTNAIHPLRPATMLHLRGIAHLFPNAVAGIAQSKSLASLPALLPDLLVLVLPGAVTMLVLWVTVRLVFRRSGAGGILLHLGARPPRDGDPNEKRLADLVEEMAIAAGVAAPRLMLIDSPAPNAAAVGTSLHDVTIIVTKGLVGSLDRNETESIIANVIASVGNGDLPIANTLLSVYQTFGLLNLLLMSAFGPKARRALWRVVRLAFMRRGTDRERSEAGEVAALLEAHASESGTDEMDEYDRRHARSGGIFSLLRLPLQLFVGFPALTVQFTLFIATTVVFGPTFAALWRARRRLADASAVQLTRDPESLALALQRLSTLHVAVPGGGSVALLFAVWDSSLPGSSGSGAGMFDGFQPSIEKRLKRLHAMGAALRAGQPMPRGAVWIMVALGVIIGPLLLLALGASLVALSMMFLLDVLFMVIMLLGTDWLLFVLFKYGPGWLHKGAAMLGHWIASSRK